MMYYRLDSAQSNLAHNNRQVRRSINNAQISLYKTIDKTVDLPWIRKPNAIVRTMLDGFLDHKFSHEVF
jgi:hypothetical protein